MSITGGADVAQLDTIKYKAIRKILRIRLPISVAPGLVSHPERIEQDLTLVKRLVSTLEEELADKRGSLRIESLSAGTKVRFPSARASADTRRRRNRSSISTSATCASSSTPASTAHSRRSMQRSCARTAACIFVDPSMPRRRRARTVRPCFRNAGPG